jgi:hypothetical protein
MGGSNSVTGSLYNSRTWLVTTTLVAAWFPAPAVSPAAETEAVAVKVPFAIGKAVYVTVFWPAAPSVTLIQVQLNALLLVGVQVPGCTTQPAAAAAAAGRSTKNE